VRYPYEPGQVFRTLQAYVKDPRPALVGIGAYLLSRSQKAFREQRYGKKPWPSRAVPNMMGVVRYLREKGPIPPTRYLDPTPALVDTGQLKMSLAMRVTAKNQVQVGSVLPYASLMNFGGQSTQEVTPLVKSRLANLLSRQPWASYYSALSWITNPNVSQVSVKVPARPFVGMDDDAKKNIINIVSQAGLGNYTVTYL